MDTYNDRLRELGYSEDQYRAYLRAPHWQAIKDQVHDDCRPCFCCLSVPTDENPHDLHHFNYDTLGRETPADLVQVCRTCHTEIHRLIRYLNLPLDQAHQIYRACRIANGQWAADYGILLPRAAFKRARRLAAKHGLDIPAAEEQRPAAVVAIDKIRNGL